MDLSWQESPYGRLCHAFFLHFRLHSLRKPMSFIWGWHFSITVKNLCISAVSRNSVSSYLWFQADASTWNSWIRFRSSEPRRFHIYLWKYYQRDSLDALRSISAAIKNPHVRTRRSTYHEDILLPKNLPDIDSDCGDANECHLRFENFLAVLLHPDFTLLLTLCSAWTR